MDEAISSLSVKCNPADSNKALYLLSAPAKEMNLDLIKELGAYLKSIAPQAIIRSGDYPREGGSLDVSLVLSELSDVPEVRNYFNKTIKLFDTMKKRQEGMPTTPLEGTLKDIPSLL